METVSEIFGKALQKDENAFEELIKPLQKPVYIFLLRMGINAEDCKDICANVFIKVFLNIGKCRDARGFAPWVFAIARNESADFFRKNKLKTRALTREDIDFSPGPEEEYIEKERAAQLINAVNALKPRLRAFIVLRDIEGFSYENIAEITGVSIGTVKSRISRARAALAANLSLIEKVT